MSQRILAERLKIHIFILDKKIGTAISYSLSILYLQKKT